MAIKASEVFFGPTSTAGATQSTFKKNATRKIRRRHCRKTASYSRLAILRGDSLIVRRRVPLRPADLPITAAFLNERSVQNRFIRALDTRNDKYDIRIESNSINKIKHVTVKFLGAGLWSLRDPDKPSVTRGTHGRFFFGNVPSDAEPYRARISAE